jgi:hypothetical protein
MRTPTWAAHVTPEYVDDLRNLLGGVAHAPEPAELRYAHRHHDARAARRDAPALCVVKGARKSGQ